MCIESRICCKNTNEKEMERETIKRFSRQFSAFISCAYTAHVSDWSESKKIFLEWKRRIETVLFTRDSRWWWLKRLKINIIHGNLSIDKMNGNWCWQLVSLRRNRATSWRCAWVFLANKISKPISLRSDAMRREKNSYFDSKNSK